MNELDAFHFFGVCVGLVVCFFMGFYLGWSDGNSQRTTRVIIERRKLTKKELRAVQATAHFIKECVRDENGRFAKAPK